MKKIFITGANGYIGGNLAKFLSQKNFQVYGLTTKKKQNSKNLKWVYGKLNDNFNNYLKKCDLIIHCAAAGVYKKENKKKLDKINHIDSLKFLRNAYLINCKNWIIFGSSFEYGFIKNKPFSATKSKLMPIDDYGKSKVNFYKNLVKLYANTNCKILYLRAFHVYGGNEPKVRMYPSLLNSIDKNIDFMMTKGEEVRDFIHIEMVKKKIIKSFKLFKRRNFFLTKNLASGRNMTVKKFALNIHKKRNSKNKILFGKIKKKNNYHSMYSDKNSLL